MTRRPHGLPIPDRANSSSCFKQEPLFDRYGNVVARLHGAECQE